MYYTLLGKGAISYAKSNPGTVATEVGAASILGATTGMLFLAGILGGKKIHSVRKKRHSIKKKRHSIRKKRHSVKKNRHSVKKNRH